MFKAKGQPFSNDIITHPAHYIEGRVIEPITVIEEYGLCHHLACVVKYISRAGRKTSLLNDLLKAEWYLDREVMRCREKMEPCSPPLKNPPNFKVGAICEDWNLNANLDTALSYILTASLGTLEKNFTKNKPFVNYASSLKKSLKHLQLSIAEHEQGEWQ